MKSHFEKLKGDYENVHVIDLLSSKFGEGELQSIYQSLLKSEFPEIQFYSLLFFFFFRFKLFFKNLKFKIYTYGVSKR